MTKLFSSLWILLFSFWTINAYAEDNSIAEIFKTKQATGTLVLSSLKTNQKIIHNHKRAYQRLPIASTFKIFNSLIALEEKVLDDKQSVFKWNGTQYNFPTWNKDQTLESAYKVSCVWCYQEIARKVGSDKYQYYLSLANYGVLQKPFKTDSFWLDGSLQVNAFDQIELLKKIYTRSLPFSAKSYETLKEISLAEKTNDYAIYAKTGWAMQHQPQIGWYIGYVETKNDVWFFAINIDILDKNQLGLRQELTQLALKLKNIIN